MINAQMANNVQYASNAFITRGTDDEIEWYGYNDQQVLAEQSVRDQEGCKSGLCMGASECSQIPQVA